MLPRPPTSAEWEAFENSIGLTLPKWLLDRFSGQNSQICGKQLDFQAFSSFGGMSPIRSHRMLSVCTIEECGDELCLFIPRENLAPFVIIHKLELGHVLPIAEDPEAFFRDPELWRRRMNLYEEENLDLPTPPPFASEPWKVLAFDTKNASGELEFLQDLSFTQEEATEVSFFEPACSRFGNSDGSVAKVIRAAFPRAEAALKLENWLRLAEDLAASGHSMEAIRALENCVTVTVPQARPGGWRVVAQTYERMREIAELSGDTYDRTVLPHMIRLSREY